MSIVNEVLAKVKSLPPLSESAAHLLRLSGRDTIAATEIVKILEKDPMLTAHLLRIANSAAYRRAQPINSIQMAVTILGNLTVFGMALGYCMAGVFDQPLAGYDSPAGAFWKNCLCGALAARQIAGETRGQVSPDVAYTAGLLRDIGKVVLSKFLEGHLDEVMSTMIREPGQDFLAAESKRLGTNHAVVGVAVARQWRLPEGIVEVIAYQHAPSQARPEHRPLVYVVHMAAMISMMIGANAGADALSYHMDPACEQFLALSEARTDKLVLQITTEYNRLVKAQEDGEPGGDA